MVLSSLKPAFARTWPYVAARLLLLAIAAALLGACGNSVANTSAAKTDVAASSGATQTAKAESSGDASSDAVTGVRLKRINGATCKQAPVTFGQPFVKGDLAQGETVEARVDGRTLATQVNVKARNRDGSARHAVITLRAACESGQHVALIPTPVDGGQNGGDGLDLSAVLQTAFDTRISLDLEGTPWHLNARDLLQTVADNGGCERAGIFCKKWLTGALATEWVVGAPLKDAAGKAHPHLAAYFAVRAFGPAPVKRVRVDVVVENDWSYVDNPHNYDYRPTIEVAGRARPAYHPEGFTHYRQARWHRVVWWGASPETPLYARLDPAYMQSTAAVPRYAKGNLSGKLMHQRDSCPPMRSCGQTKHMENPGAQAAIGPLPRWSAAYVIDSSYPVYRWMLANTDALGSYGFHYRVKSDYKPENNGRPLWVPDHPCATLVWPARMAQCNVKPHRDDRFPKCEGDCKTPLNPQINHHPAPATAAYMATGDWYYASEMTFLANWVAFWQNPVYRKYTKGLVFHSATRGKAWSLRSYANAAYLLPDDSRYKRFFERAVGHNIDWYNKEYLHNPDANKLGLVRGRWGYPVQGVPHSGTATWQQSFFAWSLGNLVDQRFDGAKPVRDWFSRFQISLMTSDDYCWPLASAYKLQVLKTSRGEFHDTIGDVYRNSFPKEVVAAGCDPEKLHAALRKWKTPKRYHYPVNTMVGYPTSATGFPANFQIGLAADYNSSLPNAHEAWNKFASRKVQPDYSASPQFAVVPTRDEDK